MNTYIHEYLNIQTIKITRQAELDKHRLDRNVREREQRRLI